MLSSVIQESALVMVFSVRMPGKTGVNGNDVLKPWCLSGGVVHCSDVVSARDAKPNHNHALLGHLLA